MFDQFLYSEKYVQQHVDTTEMCIMTYRAIYDPLFKFVRNYILSKKLSVFKPGKASCYLISNIQNYLEPKCVQNVDFSNDFWNLLTWINHAQFQPATRRGVFKNQLDGLLQLKSINNAKKVSDIQISSRQYIELLAQKMSGQLTVYFEIRGYETQYGEKFIMILENSNKERRTIDMCWSETGWFIQLELDRQFDYTYKFQTQNAYSERIMHLNMSQYKDMQRVKIFCDFAVKYHKIQTYNQVFDKLMKITASNQIYQRKNIGQISVNLFVPFYPTRDIHIYLVGNDEEFGMWDYKDGVELKPSDKSRNFVVDFPVRNDLELEYKFVIQTPDGSIFWEACNNRSLSYKDVQHFDHLSLDIQFCFKLEDLQHLCPRFSGLNIPLSSLYSRTTAFGDFKCLKQLITYCSQANIKMIQLLPINDTNLNLQQYELSPYSAISSFAINPVYLDAISCLQACVQRYNVSEEFYNKMQQQTEQISQVDSYQSVLQLKIQFLKALYDYIKTSNNFICDIGEFENRNHYWIYGYTIFKHLHYEQVSQELKIEEQDSDDQDIQCTKCPLTQLKNLQHNSYQIRDFYGQNKEVLRFYTFQQLMLDQQLKNVRSFAAKSGLIIIGDIQISVPELSADYFSFSNVFEENSCFGAPPDFFSKDGQNWGLVLPKWESFEAIQWYRERINHSTQYYDGLRVDHALGLFRLWKLLPGQPAGSGAMGYFVPSHRFTITEIYDSFRQEFKTSLDFESFKRFFDDGFASVQAANKYTKLIEYLSAQNVVSIGENTFGLGQSLNFTLANEEDVIKAAGLIGSQRDQLHELWQNRIFLKHSDETYTPLSCNLNDETANEAFLFQKGVVGEFLRCNFIAPYYGDSASWSEYRQKFERLSNILETSGALIIAEDLGWGSPMLYELLEAKGFGGLQVGFLYENQDFSKVRQISTHDMPSFAAQIAELKENNKFDDIVNGITEKGTTAGINIFHDYNAKLTFNDQELADLAGIERLVLQILHAPNYINMLSIIDFITFQNLNQLKDFEKQRINDPAHPGYNSWTWKLPISLEQLSKNGFQDVWRKLLWVNHFFQ